MQACAFVLLSTAFSAIPAIFYAYNRLAYIIDYIWKLALSNVSRIRIQIRRNMCGCGNRIRIRGFENRKIGTALLRTIRLHVMNLNLKIK